MKEKNERSPKLWQANVFLSILIGMKMSSGKNLIQVWGMATGVGWEWQTDTVQQHEPGTGKLQDSKMDASFIQNAPDLISAQGISL